MNQTTSIKETSTNPAESTYTAIVLAPETNLPWARELLNALQPAHTASNIAQLIQLLKKKKVDAVIALEPTEALLAFFQSIEQHRLIRVLVTDHFDRSDLNESADVVCPPLPRYIHQQIGQAAQVKAERNRLHQEIESLRADNQALQAKLDVEQETIHELEVLKSAIVRNVSHELRTPLLQVKSAVALMDKDTENAKLIEYATDATAKLEAVVTNVTQLITSLDEINPSPVLLRECVEHALRSLGRSWERKGNIGRVRLRVDKNLPPVWGDRLCISTVIQQLIDNALKFSEKDVDILVRRQGERVHVMVKDYGIGISEDRRQAIFQAFYQVDNSSTRHYNGMGVGLAIVQLILERHDEVINLASEPGKGSTFMFSLPIVPIEAI